KESQNKEGLGVGLEQAVQINNLNGCLSAAAFPQKSNVQQGESKRQQVLYCICCFIIHIRQVVGFEQAVQINNLNGCLSAAAFGQKSHVQQGEPFQYTPM
ncbi:MAG: hypothetical protein RR827_05100, partial [Oscillospiraceae bacterium]